jgi:hypothetical protein
MRHTDGHTNIYSIYRDKLSLLRELISRLPMQARQMGSDDSAALE